MNLIDIILNSISRQKTKKLFLLLAVILSITTVLTLYTFSESQTYKIEKQFDEYGANIVITPKTDKLSLSYGGISFNEVLSIDEIKKEDLLNINSIKDIASIRAISPKLIGAVEVTANEKTETVVIVGTDISETYKINGWWDNKENTPLNDNDLIIGFDVAKILNLSEGDSIIIKGREFNVSTVLEVSGNQDDQVIIAKIEVVEQILDRYGKISLVEVSALCIECPIEELVDQLSKVLPNANVRGLREVMVQRMEVVDQIKRYSLAVTIILILLCSLLIFSNMASTVNERKHEIGIYRAIGFTKKNIIFIVLLESLLISILAAFFGIILSVISSYIGLPRFTGIEIEDIVINKLFYIKSIFIVLILGTVSSLIPAIKASNTDPVKAINSL